MIEVEKKFQPTEEQLKAMLEGAEFVSEKENVDIYYDIPNCDYFKKGYHLRKRNAGYELKIKLPKSEGQANHHYEEIENNADILERLGFSRNDDLEKMIAEKMETIIQFKTKRKEYHKDEFVIDIDETDFGYNVVEIELMVEDISQTKEAEEKILTFAKEYGWDTKKLPGKITTFLQMKNPKLYEELYGQK